ncbi:hypothetical protein ABBQ32_012677 [Trebouxia sp. C0010 RCD-2024]
MSLNAQDRECLRDIVELLPLLTRTHLTTSKFHTIARPVQKFTDVIMEQQQEASGSGTAPTGSLDSPTTMGFDELGKAVRSMDQRIANNDVQMGDVHFAMENLPEVLELVVGQVADQCASQDDVAKLATLLQVSKLVWILLEPG